MKEDEQLTSDEYLTTKEVAKKLRRSRRTILDYIADGCLTNRGRIYLDATKVGKSWLIHPEWLECGFQKYRTAITLNPGQPFQ